TGRASGPNSLHRREAHCPGPLHQRPREKIPTPPRINRAIAHSTLLFLGYRPTDLGFRVLLRSLLTKLRNRKHVAVQVVTFGDQISAAHIQRTKDYLDRRYRELDNLDVAVLWGSSCREIMVKLRGR